MRAFILCYLVYFFNFKIFISGLINIINQRLPLLNNLIHDMPFLVKDRKKSKMLTVPSNMKQIIQYKITRRYQLEGVEQCIGTIIYKIIKNKYLQTVIG